jgi:multidrug transporter EmrE-like cation transporter
MSDPSPGALVALGIIVGLLSTCVQSVGLTLQRKSHMLEDEKEDFGTRRPPYRRRRWQVGMFLFLIANIIGSTIQITTLPLPLLSTLQASGLVFNSLLASLLLKEPWTLRTAYGTVLVAAGAVFISLFSALPEPSHNLRQLLVLLNVPGFLAWFILSLLFVGGILVTDFSLRKCIAVQKRDNARIRLIRGMSYGLASGILSAHALLLAKSATELIVRSLADHNNQFRGYQSWILLLAFLVLALSQLYYLHLGLKLISTSILYPFVFCIYNIVAILDGLIYFRQMDRLPALHAGLIALGTVILLSGVLALSWRLQDEENGDQPPMAQAEIPQTLLTPGSGFAADPDDETNESAVPSDDGFGSETEESILLPKTRSRSKTSVNRMNGLGRRKRASTLREVSQIWQELADDNEPTYGTFYEDPSHPSSNGRPSSAGQYRQRTRRRSSAGRSLEDGPDEISLEGEPQSLQRSKTVPSQRRSTSGKRRRKSGHEGGALFSELLKKDWWRTRRKDDEEDPPPSGGGRKRSASSTGHA